MTKLERLAVGTVAAQLAFYTAVPVVCNGVASLTFVQLMAVVTASAVSFVLAGVAVAGFSLRKVPVSAEAPASA